MEKDMYIYVCENYCLQAGLDQLNEDVIDNGTLISVLAAFVYTPRPTDAVELREDCVPYVGHPSAIRVILLYSGRWDK